MQLAGKETLKIDIDNYSGPLEVLLDLAKAQKVDLANISISQLADQFIEFISSAKKINLDLASEYLLMATWLAYLKSKLLLPEEEDDNFKAGEVAERLKLQLKKLELIRLLSDQLLKRNNHIMRKNFFSINITKLPVCTTEQGIEIIKASMKKLKKWRDVSDLIPSKFKKTTELKKTGLSGLFSASLELTREGLINIMQKNAFDKLLIKEKK